MIEAPGSGFRSNTHPLLWYGMTNSIRGACCGEGAFMWRAHLNEITTLRDTESRVKMKHTRAGKNVTGPLLSVYWSIDEVGLTDFVSEASAVLCM